MRELLGCPDTDVYAPTLELFAATPFWERDVTRFENSLKNIPLPLPVHKIDENLYRSSRKTFSSFRKTRI